jgi:hypothetical protein
MYKKKALLKLFIYSNKPFLENLKSTNLTTFAQDFFNRNTILQ